MLPSAALAALLASAGLTGAPDRDVDQDGVADDADALPCDARAAAVISAPAEGQMGVLLFEDQWPAASDLDFNDVVVAWNHRTLLTAAGAPVEVTLTLQPLALGGSYHLGLGVRLPVGASTVVEATRAIGGAAAQAVTRSNLDSQATLYVSNDLRELFTGADGPINSRTNEARRGSSSVVVRVTLAGATSFDPSQVDLFVFRTDNPAHETHLPQFGGTARMNTALFGSGVDASTASRHYVDRDGLPYALSLPSSAYYPREATPIAQLYPNIVTFASSGGAGAANFYTSPVTSYAYADVAGLGQLTPAAPSAIIDRTCVRTSYVTPLLLVNVDFEDGTATDRGSYNSPRAGNLNIASSGGVSNGAYASGWSIGGNYLDMPDRPVYSSGEDTWVAWYRGTQAHTGPQTPAGSAYYQTGVIIFGDPLNSVWGGMGVDQGRIAIANHFIARGTTNVADGRWHQLVWVRTNTNWDAYVDGVREISGFNGNGGGANFVIRQIGSGYPYFAAQAATALDEIQVWSRALSAADVAALFANQPLAAMCSDGVLNGGETALDCGGSCGACPTCTDGVQNGSELGVDCGGSCPGICPLRPVVELTFDGATIQDTGTTGGTTVVGAVTRVASGGAFNRGYATNFSINARYLDIVDRSAQAANAESYVAWYRGTQTNTSGAGYSPGVPIFGDATGGVYGGIGLNGGRICVSNSNVAVGTTNVADGQWHLLVWTRNGTTWNAYVDGVREITNYTTSVGTFVLRNVGNGYPYANVVAPTALDDVLIYDQVIDQGRIQSIYATGAW